MLMKQLLALKPAQVVEQTLEERYEESSDFDADMSRIEVHLKAVQKIVMSKNFQQHMKDTDANFVAATSQSGAKAIDLLDDTVDAFDEFYQDMEKAA